MGVREGGLRIRAERERRRLTQQELANKAGVTNQVVSRLELGTVDQPDMERLVAVGGALGWTPNQIATIYGYWKPQAGDLRGDLRLERISAVVEQLDILTRERVLDTLVRIAEAAVYQG